jgi:hypothetical protein
MKHLGFGAIGAALAFSVFGFLGPAPLGLHPLIVPAYLSAGALLVIAGKQ